MVIVDVHGNGFLKNLQREKSVLLILIYLYDKKKWNMRLNI